MGKVASDFVKVSDHLKEASYQIRKREYSKFPIFIVSTEEIELGALFLTKQISKLYIITGQVF